MAWVALATLTTASGCADEGAPTASGLAMAAAEDATEEAAPTTAPAATPAGPDRTSAGVRRAAGGSA